MPINATTETAIFERIVLPSEPVLNGHVARSIVAMQFSPEDRERMQLLADKAKQGTLTPGEEAEIDTYERVGHYLAILQSKARVALRAVGDANS